MSSLERLVEAVTPYYERNDPAHDLAHALRVTALAREISRHEGGDLEVVLAGAICHDIGRWEAASHSEETGSLIVSLLDREGYDARLCQKIKLVVQRHSLSSPSPPEALEEKIVFDADKLESLGAIAIARCFAVSGSLDQSLFDSGDDRVTAQRMLGDHLARSYGRLHTETARRIGKERHEFLLRYIEQLEAELAVVANIQTGSGVRGAKDA